MANYDVVIIGAGNGGLTAAAALAKKGLKTLLLERHNVPGGCATSFTRGRFEFEVALHQLSGMGTREMPGPLRMFLSDLEVVDELEWVEMNNLYRIMGIGELDITLGANREQTIKTLQERFPAESQGIGDFFDLLYKFFMEVVNGFFMKDPEMGPKKYPLYFEYALTSVEEVVSQFISDPLLKTAIYPYWSYMAVPPSSMAFSDYAALMFSYLEFKPYHLKGGSQALSNVLIEKYLNWGGEVRFNCGAKKILVENRQVTGVITDYDEVINTRYIASNASTLAVYTEMIDPEHVPEEQFKLLGGSNIGVSSLTLYVGLDCEPGEVGITETTNFIFPSTDMDYLFSRTKVLDASEDGILLTCYNMSDPDASPPGTSHIGIVDVKYFDAWMDVPPAEYYRTKYECADQLLNVVEKHFPGFREHIEEIEVATPLTHYRYLNTPGGAIYGFEQFSKNSNLFVSPKSPINGLYFVGSWAGDGGFQPSLMSGGTAARAIIRSLKQGVK